MGTKVGLWVDHRKSVIVFVTDQGEEIKLIISTAEKQLRRAGDSPLKGSYESQKVPADDSRKARLTGTLNIYYDAVIACIRDAESILILGPGEAKGELKKRIEKSALSKRIVGIETVDKMTDRQITAKVRQYFKEISDGKTIKWVPPKRIHTFSRSSGRRKNMIKIATMLLATFFLFILDSNVFCQETRDESFKEGYGTYGTMGQDPDEIMKYGQYMMRYGFHEAGMPGGSNEYPGYNANLSDKTIKELNAEQLAFIKSTEDLRQTIYEKELYLKAEMVKKAPDSDKALNFQKSISDARGKFEQMMIEHLIRMKKINLEAKRK